MTVTDLIHIIISPHPLETRTCYKFFLAKSCRQVESATATASRPCKPGETSAKNIPSACPLLESCTDPARQRTGTTHSMLKEDAACGVPETAWTAGPALQQARRGRAPWGESDQLFLSSLRGNTFSSSTLLGFKKRSCNRLANQIKLLERAGRRNSQTRPPWVPQCGRAARARVAAPPSSSILRRPPAPCRNAVRGFFQSGRRDHGTHGD